MIVLIVVVGGITRLTESGLSITTWRPVTGMIPPLNEAQWLAEFENYKKIPEYYELNQGMSLAAFKTIFFWEYIHRVIARLIGFAFAIPLIWFAVKRQIPHGYGLRLVGLLILGGLQGVVGWWMVTSGLTERTDVSHVRLTTHLMIALITLAGVVWTALDLQKLARRSEARPARITGFGAFVGLILFVQLVYGGLVAGLNAGLVTNEWPLMNGQFVPGITHQGLSFFRMIVDDPAIVHFIHRWWAWVAVVVMILLARRARKTDRRVSIAINATIGLQILLGIGTVMSGMNITMAAMHQFVGALIVVAATWGIHVIGRRA